MGLRLGMLALGSGVGWEAARVLKVKAMFLVFVLESGM
jgi:hypothetical protein